MSLQELLQWVVGALRSNNISHMITGSTAAGWHGAPRTTLDVDLVIDPTREQLDRLLVSLRRPGLYVPDQAAHEALARQEMFNVIDTPTGFKADLIVRKSRPFSRTEFQRRIPVELAGIPTFVATLEDVIVAKLEWASMGSSARQLDDVAALLDIAGVELDREYIGEWTGQLGLAAEWDAARRRHERGHP